MNKESMMCEWACGACKKAGRGAETNMYTSITSSFDEENLRIGMRPVWVFIE